jgi:hypothetical protein
MVPARPAGRHGGLLMAGMTIGSCNMSTPHHIREAAARVPLKHSSHHSHPGTLTPDSLPRSLTPGTLAVQDASGERAHTAWNGLCDHALDTRVPPAKQGRAPHTPWHWNLRAARGTLIGSAPLILQYRVIQHLCSCPGTVVPSRL